MQTEFPADRQPNRRNGTEAAKLTSRQDYKQEPWTRRLRWFCVCAWLFQSRPDWTETRPFHKLLGNFSATFHVFGNFFVLEQLSVRRATWCIFLTTFQYFSTKLSTFTNLSVIYNTDICKLVYWSLIFIVWKSGRLEYINIWLNW